MRVLRVMRSEREKRSTNKDELGHMHKRGAFTYLEQMK